MTKSEKEKVEQLRKVNYDLSFQLDQSIIRYQALADKYFTCHEKLIECLKDKKIGF